MTIDQVLLRRQPSEMCPVKLQQLMRETGGLRRSLGLCNSETHILYAIPHCPSTLRPGLLLRICINDVRLGLWANLLDPRHPHCKMEGMGLCSVDGRAGGHAPQTHTVDVVRGCTAYTGTTAVHQEVF